VSISIKNQTGLYRGAFFIIGKKEISIPITVDIKPTEDRVIIWVINGVAIAVAGSKIAKFHINRGTKSLQTYLIDTHITSAETIAKNVFLDVASILFATIIGLFGLLNDAFVNGVHALDSTSIGLLIVIGLGIGGFKEYLNSISSIHQ